MNFHVMARARSQNNVFRRELRDQLSGLVPEFVSGSGWEQTAIDCRIQREPGRAFERQREFLVLPSSTLLRN